MHAANEQARRGVFDRAVSAPIQAHKQDTTETDCDPCRRADPASRPTDYCAVLLSHSPRYFLCLLLFCFFFSHSIVAILFDALCQSSIRSLYIYLRRVLTLPLLLGTYCTRTTVLIQTLQRAIRSRNAFLQDRTRQRSSGCLSRC